MRTRLEDRGYVERYVHALTHEMKSPLAAIHGAAELLEEEMPEADRRRFLAHIQEQEARLRLLVERMLGLAAVERRQGLEHPVRVSLRSCLEGVAAAKTAQLAAGDIRLASSVAEDGWVTGEAFLLEQALSNLLDNAIDFSPRGGVVEIALESTERTHALVFRDQGGGIPDYALERVFEPFYSLPRPGSGLKSTGLGLSFVKEVAELHGGAVALANGPEGGAVARLTLPRA
jgi:two-component system sensor histidine kinase CreC